MMPMRRHARFEALGGAIALGEATPGERAAFEAHARACGECSALAGLHDGELREVTALAEASERWQPIIDGRLYERIVERRRSSFRRTTNAFSYAIALSLVLNVAFVTGLGTRAMDALRALPDARSDVQPVALVDAPKVEAPEPALAVKPIAVVAVSMRQARRRAERVGDAILPGADAALGGLFEGRRP